MKGKNKTRLFSSKALYIALLAFLSGVTNGVLGAGGGIILIFLLAHLFKGEENGTKASFAVSCTAVLALSAISTISYTGKGTISFADAAPYLLPALVGGLIGALVLQRINTLLLKRIFAVLLIYGGIRMIV